MKDLLISLFIISIINYGGKIMANAILAAVLSFLVPGLGQAYAGDIKKGIIFFIVFLVIIGLYVYFLNKYLPFNIIELIFGIYAAYDGYQMAKA